MHGGLPRGKSDPVKHSSAAGSTRRAFALRGISAKMSTDENGGAAMNLWVLILFAVLIFAPKSSSSLSRRFDYRALALLLCVIALIAQV
jgi:hypothetical protein